MDSRKTWTTKLLEESLALNRGRRRERLQISIFPVVKMLALYELLSVIVITLQICPSLVALTTCNTTFNQRSGTFFSPAFYKPNTTNIEKCKWRISVSPDEKIVLNVTVIDIEKTPNCNSGNLEVRDGFWEDSPLLGKYCGNGSLNLIASTTNKLLISYQHRVGYRGFLGEYEAICGEEIYVRSQFILHSNEPQEKYPLNRKCIWKVTVPVNHQIVLRSQKFQIEYEERCMFDYVEFYDSNSTALGRFCGEELSGNITSTLNTLTIKFVSDDSVQKEGFSFLLLADYDECVTKEHQCDHECINTIGSYKCVCRRGYKLQIDGKSCEIECGGILNALNGAIHSYSFPQEYPRNTTCIWKIVVPDDNVIHLSFFSFDIKGDSDNHSFREKCEKNKLEIFNGEETDPQPLGTYCGSVLPNLVVSEGSTMKIIFSTDNSVERSGFALTYSTVGNKCDKFGGNCHHRCVSLQTYRKCICPENYTTENNLDCSRGCHYEIASPSGIISSPNYPNYYQNNANCTWRFKTTPGHRIQIVFSDIQTTDCDDYVRVYDNYYPSNASILLEVCGNKTNITGLSTTNELSVNFISDSLNVYQGFNATYSSVCGGNLTASTTEKYVYSHDTYGLSNYYDYTDCVWIIKANSGYYVNLSVEVLDIEFSSYCNFDFIEIREGDISRGKFCGNEKPEEFLSSDNFTVKFHTDYSVAKRGFRLMYKAVQSEEVHLN
ncbi:tolloid-like protein 1 [Zophobas morio]|uniref:tolloid-like protein 1 n=1 Tax=Zophobas morio TaxID=2755281 RepID=UPI0030834067